MALQTRSTTLPARLRVSTNQAPPLAGHDVVAADRALIEAVLRHASAEVLDDLPPLGVEAGIGRGPRARACSPTSTTPS